MPDFSHAFQPLLKPFDDYSSSSFLNIFSRKYLPVHPGERRISIHTWIIYLSKKKHLFEKNQRFLEQTRYLGDLSRTRNFFVLFRLCFARWLGGRRNLGRCGIRFFREGNGKALRRFDKVNTFRNTRVAHARSRWIKLTKPGMRWSPGSVVWLR